MYNYMSKTSKRKTIYITTLKKVKNFLKKQKEPMFKSDVARAINVDYNSLDFALGELNITLDKNGRIKI